MEGSYRKMRDDVINAARLQLPDEPGRNKAIEREEKE